MNSLTVPAARLGIDKLPSLDMCFACSRALISAGFGHDHMPIACRYDDIQHEKIRHLFFIIIVVNVVNHRREYHFHIDLSASGTLLV